MSGTPTLPTHDNPLFDQLPEYRDVLEEQWRQQVATIVELSYDALSPSAGVPDDDASATHRLQVTSPLIAAARQQLEETEAALARVNDGSYGLCGTCREPITPERLEILPAARCCVSCQRHRSARR